MNTADTFLLDQWRERRDADAFAEIVQRHSGMVFATCRRILGNPSEAEDVAQECFIELMNAGARVRSSLPAWLHTMALHRSLDRIRREKRRRAREERYAETAGAAGAVETIDDVLAQVDEAIAQLPEALRDCVIRRFLEGESHQAIAERVGCAEPTVRYRIGKGIEKVREALKRKGVPVGAGALASLMAKERSGVAPAGLAVRLGKLALSGAQVPAGQAAASPVALLSFSMASAGVKGLAVGAAIALIAGLCAWQALRAARLPEIAAPETVLASKTDTSETADEAEMPEPPGEERSPAAETTTASEGSGAAPVAEGGMVTGRIFDAESGEGIEGVRLRAHPPSGGREAGRSERSDASGMYRITGLAPGSYSVGSGGVVRGYPGATSRVSKTVTVAVEKPTEGIDFALEPGIRVAGRVVSATRVPVPVAEVAGSTERLANPERSQSNEEGVFELFFALPADSLALCASTEGLTSGVQTGLRLPQEGLTGIELVLDEPKAGSVSGVVKDAAGAPLTGATVHLLPEKHRNVASSGAAKCGSDGSFQVAHLAAGGYGILVSPPGVNGYVSSEVLYQVELARGQALAGLEILFGEKGGLAIAGHIRDAFGAPVAQARVLCHPGSESVYSDKDGAFLVTGLEEGTYSLSAFREGHSHASVRAPAGEMDVSIVLKDLVTVRGRVLRADSGEPIPVFEASFINGQAGRMKPDLFMNARRIEDPLGCFSFENVYAEPVVVSARAPGFAPAFVNLTSTAREAVSEVTLRLEPMEPIRGKVVGPAGEPVAGAVVFLDGGAQGLTQLEREPLARSAADGSFTIDSWSPENRVVGAYYPGYAPAGAPIADEVRIVLEASGQLEGTVVCEGVPVAEGSVIARADAERQLPYLRGPVNEGRYALSNVPPGTVTVTVRAGRGAERRSLSREATVRAGQSTRMDFSFPAGTASVSGVVTRGGVACERAYVRLSIATEAGEEVRGTVVNGDGSFRLEGLPSGRAELVVTQYDAVTNREIGKLEIQLDITENAAVVRDLDFGVSAE